MSVKKFNFPFIHIEYTLYTTYIHREYTLYTCYTRLVYTLYTPCIRLVYTLGPNSFSGSELFSVFFKQFYSQTRNDNNNNKQANTVEPPCATTFRKLPPPIS